jgi:hypothetical protein
MIDGYLPSTAQADLRAHANQSEASVEMARIFYRLYYCGLGENPVYSVKTSLK